jgi:ribosomal protein L11 methyltransferase
MVALMVTVPAVDEDAATFALWQAGTAGIEVLPGRDTVALRAYFTEPPTPQALLALPRSARVAPAEVPEVDWVTRFRTGFRSFRVGGFLVAPPWEEAADAADVILVEPGRAFGTGTHETTRLCLRALEQLARQRPLGRCLDLGCGTGLLAVAAARRGASHVTACDIDADAIASVALHARLNRVSLGIVRADGARAFQERAFDLVLANLTAPLLLERAGEVSSLLAPGGALVLSGFLEDDWSAVAQAYARLGRPDIIADGEWRALVVAGIHA